MKKSIPYIIIAVLVFLLWTKSCNSKKPEPKIIEVEVPAQSGDFEPKEPVHTPIVHNPTQSKDSIEIKWKEKENPINQKLIQENRQLLAKYKNAKDSLKRYKMYVQAVQLRDFQTHFEDDYIDLTISGKVQGKIKSIKPKYTIKPRTATKKIYPEQTVFRLLGGVEFGNNTLLNDFRYKFNLGFQNAKGNILSVSYEKWNNIDYYWIGYDISIFSIEH